MQAKNKIIQKLSNWVESAKKNSKIIYDVPRHTLECTENKIWNKNEIISKKTSKNTYLIKNKLKIHMKPRMWWHLTQNTNTNN